MNNTRFATSVHILVLLAREPHQLRSSEWIAGSININPVIVRREIAVLKEAGLVECHKGKEGGCRLAKEADQVMLSEIYLAVRNSEILGKKNREPNPDCAVGKSINQHLALLFSETENAVVKLLESKSLAVFSEKF